MTGFKARGRASLAPGTPSASMSRASPEIQVESIGLGDISADITAELHQLYTQAYFNSHMYEYLQADIAQRPTLFRLFLARLANSSGALVGARVIERKPHPFVEYDGYPPVHWKRFSIAPSFRGQGIGKLLVAESTRYAFQELALKVIFGESNEVGALSMHGREGALYLLASIQACSPRNSPDENVAFFREFLANPTFRSYRFPAGDGIQFVYCADADTAAAFRARGYLSKSELLGHSA
jgi:GNAT superfamily N-acetyltransferase